MLRLRTKSKTPHGGWRYVEQATGHEIRDDVYDNLVEQVLSHKKAHGIQLTETWAQEVEDTVALLLDVDDPENWAFDPTTPPADRMSVEGRKLWRELHAYALAYPEQPTEEDRQVAERWFRSWESRIPGGLNCICSRHWRQLGLGLPELSSRDAFYEWTVMAQNKVNVSLGRPIFQHGQPWP
jgi:hypothetical protein